MALARSARAAVSSRRRLEAAVARRREAGAAETQTRRAAADAAFHQSRRGRRSATRTDADRAHLRRAGRRRRARRGCSRSKLRPAPGVSPHGGQMLSASAYDIRALERGERAEEQTYVIRFRERIADGRVAILRLRLSDEAGLDDETYELRAAHRAALRGDGGELRPRLERRPRRRRAALRILSSRRPRAARKKATPPPSPMRRRASGSSRSPLTRRPRRSTFCARARRCASRRRSTILPSRPTAGGCASSRKFLSDRFTNSPSRQAR